MSRKTLYLILCVLGFAIPNYFALQEGLISGNWLLYLDPGATLQYEWCVGREWKLILRHDGEDTTQYRNVHVWDEAPARLYQIRKDPDEKHDLAGEKPEMVEQLRKEIAEWRARMTW